MMHDDEVVILSAGIIFLSISLAGTDLFVSARDPSTFASAHGLTKVFTFLLSAIMLVLVMRL